VLKALEHPCLVKVRGHILPENRGEPVYLLREFVEGGALDPSTLDATGKALILLSIVRGIEYLHEQNIVHGDIKPTNVLVTSSGVGKLSDFGSARYFELGLTQTSLPVTALYAAPELLNGEVGSEKSDVYSFALLAFELETGNPVFNPKIPLIKLVMDIQSDRRPALPSGMHPVLKSIVERGWKADPAERPTMAEICTELSKVEWLVFGGADAGRVKREAAGLQLSQSVSKAMQQAWLSETQVRMSELEHEIATSFGAAAVARPSSVRSTEMAHAFSSPTRIPDKAEAVEPDSIAASNTTTRSFIRPPFPASTIVMQSARNSEDSAQDPGPEQNAPRTRRLSLVSTTSPVACTTVTVVARP
jgi:serine/threonine protein kinase